MKQLSSLSRVARWGLVLLLTAAAGCQKDDPKAAGPATSTADSTITTFVHPGVVNSRASLDLIASQANAGDAQRLSGYSKVTQYMDQYPVPTSFPSVVYAVGSGGSPTEDQIRRDAILAYACALRWVKTGSATYANQAKQILNGYAYNFQRYDTAPKPDGSPTEFRQTYLEAAWVAPSFVAAGEIIRYYQVNGTGAGWSPTDINKFSDFLNNLKNNYVNNIPGAIGDVNNWQASYCYAKMALGVWFNSTTVYDSGYDYLLQIMPQITYSDGALKEQRDRDCVHPQYSLCALTYAAETARIQGNTALYAANNQQIRRNFEKFEDAAAGNYTRNCSGSQIFPGIETAYNYYQTSKLASLRDRQDPYGAPGDKTFLGFTTFTHRGIGR
jgi:hypothetical protein